MPRPITSPHFAHAVDVVTSHTAREIDGVLLDAQTANLIVNVYEKITEAQRAKLDALSLERVAALCWKLVHHTARGES